MSVQDMVSMLSSQWRRLCTLITNTEVERAVNQCIFQELTKLNDPVERFFDIVNSFYLCNHYNPMEERLACYQVNYPH